MARLFRFITSVYLVFFASLALIGTKTAKGRKTNVSMYPFDGNLTLEMSQLNEKNAPKELLEGPPDPVVCVMLCSHVDKPTPRATLCEWEYWVNRPVQGAFGMLDKWHQDDSLCSNAVFHSPHRTASRCLRSHGCTHYRNSNL